jgi:putative effector of murein hydrolase
MSTLPCSMDRWSAPNDAKLVHLLVGPAAVALAVPLYANLRTIRRSASAIPCGVVMGAISAAVCAVCIA